MRLKIMHIMKDRSDSSGVPTLPFLLFHHMKRLTPYENIAIITRKYIDFSSTHLNYYDYDKVKVLSNPLYLIIKILIFKPDIIILHHYFGSPLGVSILFLSRFLKIRTIVRPDFNEYGLLRSHNSFVKTIKYLLKLALIHLSIILADKLLFPTKYELDVLSRIRKIPKEKYLIIHFGIDWDIKTSEKRDYILTVSRWWRDRKNLHTILRVFSEIIKDYPNIKLVVVGKFLEGRDIEFEIMYGKKMTGEEYRTKIMSLIHKLNIQDYVIFVGVKQGEKLQELFRKAKIYYMPTKFETFGMVFVEAMASGTPIVAMKNSAVQYVVKDGVTGFLRNTEEGQKEAILRLLTDEKLYKGMQKNCLKEAEKYKWENVIKKWERLIEELMEK